MMALKSLLLLLPLLVFCDAGLIPKIVNGFKAKPGQFPYQVSLQTPLTGHSFCGGSIFNENYVITAAHCVVGKLPKDVLVVAGTINLNEKPQSVHQADKIYVHEKYNAEDAWVNDIALIKVKTPFVVSSLVSFVPMPQPKDIANTDDIATVSGFGRLAYQGATTKELHWVEIVVADQKYCKDMYKSSLKNIRTSHVCAYNPNKLQGACNGDSGGPLMVKEKLAGIVSWSRRCVDLKYPSVYTRVTSYLDWIKKHAV